MISGPFKDRFSSKSLLLVSISASALYYFLTQQADSLTMLYFSRFPALFQHAFLAARTYIADVTPPETRASYLGKITLSYSIGLIFGPMIGGLITKDNIYRASQIASFISLISFIFVWRFLESS